MFSSHNLACPAGTATLIPILHLLLTRLLRLVRSLYLRSSLLRLHLLRFALLLLLQSFYPRILLANLYLLLLELLLLLTVVVLHVQQDRRKGIDKLCDNVSFAFAPSLFLVVVAHLLEVALQLLHILLACSVVVLLDPCTQLAGVLGEDLEVTLVV